MCDNCTPEQKAAKRAHNDQAIAETNAYLDKSIAKFREFKETGADKYDRISQAVTELTFLWNNDRLDEELMISVLAVATDRLAFPEDYPTDADEFWVSVMGMPAGGAPVTEVVPVEKCDYCGKPKHYGRGCW